MVQNLPGLASPFNSVKERAPTELYALNSVKKRGHTGADLFSNFFRHAGLDLGSACLLFCRDARDSVHMKKTLRGSIILLALLLGLVMPARAELDLDFTLVNKTGYDIKEVYIGPTSVDEWGDNLIKNVLKDGQSLELKFSEKASAEKWDIKVIYSDGETAWWKGYKLTEISKINLFWSADKKSTATVE